MNRLSSDLFTLLAGRRDMSAKEIASALKVSRPTVSRLLADVGDQVCAIGRARATRYALTRSLPGLGPRLPIWEVDEAGSVRPHGVLHLLAHGGHWLERRHGPSELFAGVPPWIWDMAPQGYIGRNFPAVHPDLGLPAHVQHWSDDHRLTALARRGEDCVGNLIIGDESFSRFLAGVPQPVARNHYPEYARRSLEGQPGSSAGGEHPKFAVFSGERHVLVKFASGADTPSAQRWRDLLRCEYEALVLLRDMGMPAPSASIFDSEGMRFLETERFDRVGLRGRKPVLSLYAVGCEYLGYLDNWTRAARDLHAQDRLSGGDAKSMRWLDAFGQLIGNTDRHFGNLSFFVDTSSAYRLAPIYDMLPMIFAPRGEEIVERSFQPSPPTAENLGVWSDAAGQALAYWARLNKLDELSDGFRRHCKTCLEAVEKLRRQVPVLRTEPESRSVPSVRPEVIQSFRMPALD